MKSHLLSATLLLVFCANGLAQTPFYRDKSDLLVWLDAKDKKQIIDDLAGWQRRKDHILANMQIVMGAYPTAAKVALDLKIEGEEILDKVVRKKISFAVAKGDRVTGYLLMPRDLKGKAPGMLCLHQTTKIGSGEPAGVGGLKNLHYALELAQRGYVALAPDYPNFGSYKVDAYAAGYDSTTMKGIWNHRCAVDLLQSLPEVDGQNLGVIGHSLGGHNALFVAAFEPRLKIVVSSCGFNAFPKYRGGDLTGWSHKGYMPKIASDFGKKADKLPFDFTEILGSLAPRAVFINAPRSDSNFEVAGVKDCVNAAAPVYQLYDALGKLEAVYPNAGHDFPPDIRLKAYSAIDRQLRHRYHFNRMIAHWAQYGDDDYLAFVDEAKPQVCQIGFYGGHFYSLAHTPQYKGYPAHFPVQGLAECGSWFKERNAEIHKRGAKVVGHFNVTFLVGEPADSPKGIGGFFKYYTELWDEKELGPRPVADPMMLLARNADGTPMSSKAYSIGGMREFTACLNNPHWRTVLKAWAKRGLERGVDGYIANYFYRHNCLCEHCQAGFRGYLAERHTPADLAKKFEIADLKTHKFTEIVGWHKPAETTPLRLEMLRWSQISAKLAFEDVFVNYARSLKPDLLLAQWNHISNFSQISGDERSLVPADLWGRDEDYLWYSTGAAAFFTDLAEGILGEGTLQARYIRGTFEDKPFTLGKYEQTRIRVAIAEMAANGGAAMGFYANHKNPESRAVFVEYYSFLAKHDALFKANLPYAEMLLLYPRQAVHAGNVEPVDAFKKEGTRLLDEHVLFDVIPDDYVTRAQRASYRSVQEVSKVYVPKGLSTFDAPKTVRVSASKSAAGGDVVLHFVNYNRDEPDQKRKAGTGAKDEKPIAVEKVGVQFVLPKDAKVQSVKIASPEAPDLIDVKYVVSDGRVTFTVPSFLVYAIARIELKE